MKRNSIPRQGNTAT